MTDAASSTTPSLAVISSVYKVQRVIDDTISLSQSDPDDSFIAQMRQCLVENLGRLERVTDGADLVSPELERVLDAYASALE